MEVVREQRGQIMHSTSMRVEREQSRNIPKWEAVAELRLVEMIAFAEFQVFQP